MQTSYTVHKYSSTQVAQKIEKQINQFEEHVLKLSFFWYFMKRPAYCYESYMDLKTVRKSIKITTQIDIQVLLMRPQNII